MTAKIHHKSAAGARTHSFFSHVFKGKKRVFSRSGSLVLPLKEELALSRRNPHRVSWQYGVSERVLSKISVAREEKKKTALSARVRNRATGSKRPPVSAAPNYGKCPARATSFSDGG